jgi:surfactin synthase thioesterase subunit
MHEPSTTHRAARPSLIAMTERPDARARIYGLSPAGSGPEFYARWAEHLPATIDLTAIQLPGRGTAAGQPCPTDPHQLCQQIADLIADDHDGRPYAIFGHSVGALLAYETTRCLTQASATPPDLLGVSAFPAPHRPDLLEAIAPLLINARSAAADFLGPIPDEVFANIPFLVAAYTPVLADLLLALQYHHHHDRPLEIPTALYAGDADKVAPARTVSAWSDLTTRPKPLHTFRGGHTYPSEHARGLANRFASDLLTVSASVACRR